MSLLVRYALLGMAVGLLVFVLKYAAYMATGSTAFYSDAVDGLAHILTSAAAAWALHISARPADADHPYGHTKAEYFSAVFEGVLIIIAVLAILRGVWHSLDRPAVLHMAPLGLLLNLLATVINLLWAGMLVRLGRRARSPALVADGQHIRTDVLASLGVFAGVVLAGVTGWHWLDPMIAGVVALNILWTGWQVVRESVGGLMDEAVSAADKAHIRQTVQQHARGAVQLHGLKTRHAARLIFIEFHLVVPGEMSVRAAHVICDRLEQALVEAVPGATVTIHVEPEEKAEAQGVNLRPSGEPKGP